MLNIEDSENLEFIKRFHSNQNQIIQQPGHVGSLTTQNPVFIVSIR